MSKQKFASVTLLALILGSGALTSEAGWPFSRKAECGPVCEQEQPKAKKKSLIGADPAPAAPVVDLVPARLTTIRAEKSKDDQTPNPAAASKNDEMEKRFTRLEHRVNELSLEIEALVHVLESRKPAN